MRILSKKRTMFLTICFLSVILIITIPAQAESFNKSIPQKVVQKTPCGESGHEVTVKHGGYGSFIEGTISASGADIDRIYLYWSFYSQVHRRLSAPPATVTIKLIIGGSTKGTRVYNLPSGYSGWLDEFNVVSGPGMGQVKAKIITKFRHYAVGEFYPSGGWTTKVTSTIVLGIAAD